MSAGTGPVTLINVFEVTAEQVDAFIGQWQQVAAHLSTAAGFRDTQFHPALSPQARFRLINIARCDSPEAFEAALSAPRSKPPVRKRPGARHTQPCIGSSPSTAPHRWLNSTG